MSVYTNICYLSDYIQQYLVPAFVFIRQKYQVLFTLCIFLVYIIRLRTITLAYIFFIQDKCSL